MERKAIQDSLLTHVIAAVGFAKGSFFLQKINRRFIATNTKNLHIIKHSQKASINEDW